MLQESREFQLGLVKISCGIVHVLYIDKNRHTLLPGQIMSVNRDQHLLVLGRGGVLAHLFKYLEATLHFFLVLASLLDNLVLKFDDPVLQVFDRFAASFGGPW